MCSAAFCEQRLTEDWITVWPRLHGLFEFLRQRHLNFPSFVASCSPPAAPAPLQCHAVVVAWCHRRAISPDCRRPVRSRPGIPTRNQCETPKRRLRRPFSKIAPDRAVDWHAYSGNRRYNSEYEVCHGFDGEGSTSAPSLLHSLKRLSYSDFIVSSVTVVKTSIPQIKGDAFVRDRPQRGVLS